MKTIPTAHDHLMRIDEQLERLLRFAPQPDPKVLRACYSRIAQLELESMYETDHPVNQQSRQTV